MKHLSTMRLINEAKDFKVNENFTENLLNFSDIKVLVVDNFYENPDIIRDYILNIPATYHTPERPSYPGRQNDMCYDLSPIGLTYQNLILKYFDDDVDVVDCLKYHPFLVNVIQNQHIDIPHVDKSEGYASSIYFNIDEECSGGLNFYIPKKNAGAGGAHFKKVGTVDMKYNRMLLYSQSVLHTPFIPEGDFTGDLHRINQQLFLENVEE